jgi:glucose/arabinose dehydrogenase
MLRRGLTVLALGLALAGFSITTAQEEPPLPTMPNGWEYRWTEVASGFGRPLYVTGANDGTDRLFVVAQGGLIHVIVDGELLPDPFLNVTSLVSVDANERGLLGLAFHPNYAENGTFFINYTDAVGDTAIARYQVSADDPNRADPSSAQFVLRVSQPYSNHNGGHLAFGPDGYLYIGLGDGGAAGDPEDRAQNPQSLLGKMLRIDVDAEGVPYAIPADNPFEENPNYLPEIWSTGLRNPWRYSFDRLTGDLFIGDVGQNEYEEVSFQPAASTGGENYGWRYREGTRAYSGEAIPADTTVVDPFAEYSHGEGGCSVTGGYVYRGALLPELSGVYFFGDYCSGLVWTSIPDGTGGWQTQLAMETNLTISSFGEDDAGELYLVSHSGAVFRLESIE